jgi:hypothetical protein
MGHSALATTTRYLHARPANEQAALFTRAFEPKLAGSPQTLLVVGSGVWRTRAHRAHAGRPGPPRCIPSAFRWRPVLPQGRRERACVGGLRSAPGWRCWSGTFGKGRVGRWCCGGRRGSARRRSFST